MCTLTISIVAYNDYEDIMNAVSSIEKYTSIDKKIYIVDNSCKEDEDLEKKSFVSFLSTYSDIEYIDTKKNLGFGKGHNMVLSKINSKYHAIVNPDVIVTEDSFSKLIEYMEENPSCGMCIPKIIDESGSIQEAYRKEITVFDMFIRFFFRKIFKKRIEEHCLKDMDYSKPFQVPFAQGCFLLIRTDLFKEINGFDDRYFMYMEDADLSKKVNERSSVMYVPFTSVIHKWSKGSHKNMRLFKIHVQSMFQYFNKWGWKWK